MGNYTAEVLGSITCLELASLGTQSIKISVTDGEIMINNGKRAEEEVKIAQNMGAGVC